ncbi:hypothetical protein MOQ72_41185 [Saccharopolyspora sp. K220]|uniref:hypothetical protein n=1 Tax=Saccharopolyspora soli TaxID=2926618 RepID=UPI001F567C7D|nr:hypothetical protein [Saccharopolyspora soli]MCI2423839.1 hypothetical protein [Saccharopolyspora soli]
MGYSKPRLNRQGYARYTAYYWDLRGRARSAGTFARKRDADRAWRRAEAEIAEGRFVDLASGRQRFQRYVTEIWLPNHTIELRCRHCRTAIAAYRRTATTAPPAPGHCRSRKTIWYPTLQDARLTHPSASTIYATPTPPGCSAAP